MPIESVMPSNHFILCHPLLLLPSVFPSIRVFSNESTLCISIGASASVPPMNIQGWFPLGLTGLISLLSKEILRVFSSTTIRKHQVFSAQPSLWCSSHICTWPLEKPHVCLVAHLCSTLCNLVDYSPPGSWVHGILQARILEWVAIPISRGSSPPRDWPGSPALQADSLPWDPPGKTAALTTVDLCQQSDVSVFKYAV